MTGRPNTSRETKFSGSNKGRQVNIHFLCSADHEQDFQPHSVDPYSIIYYFVFIYDDHIYSLGVLQLRYM